MREIGWLLISVGLLAVVGAFLFVDVSREVGYVPYASDYLPRVPREVANVHAMHIQSLIFHGGLASTLGGIICLVGAAIEDAIRRNDPKPEPTAIGDHVVGVGATREEIAAAAAYVEPDAPEPQAPTGGLVAVLLIGLVLVILIGFIVAEPSSRSGPAPDSALTNEQLNDVMMDENLALDDLNLTAD